MSNVMAKNEQFDLEPAFADELSDEALDVAADFTNVSFGGCVTKNDRP